jgi:hypothetical protein
MAIGAGAVTAEMAIAQEEVFGPVLCIVPAATVAFFPFSGWKDSFLGDPQEDRHQPLVLKRPGVGQLLRRALSRRTVGGFGHV